MDFSTILVKVLPWIGAAATGNVPALIGMAAKEVSDALGVEIPANVDAIGKAVVNATPEQIVALRSREMEFQERMQGMGFKHVEELATLEVKDRDSARDREIQTGDNANKWIAGLVIMVWMLINVLVFTQDLPPEKEMIIARILGTLDAALMCVLYYYFGGSKGSDRKTELMAGAGKK